MSIHSASNAGAGIEVMLAASTALERSNAPPVHPSPTTSHSAST